jgi:hypothetical protein
MKNPKNIIIAISFLMAASAQAQSWGFTLPGGGGFAYSSGKGGSISLANSASGGGSYAAVGRPVVYQPSYAGYGGAVLIPDRPRYCGTRIEARPSYRQEPWYHEPVPYRDHAGYIRRGPRTSYTSHWVVYPNVW